MVWSEFPSLFLRNPWSAFDPGFAALVSESSERFPKANFWGDDAKLVAMLEVPGLKVEACDICIEGKSLTVSGERAPTERVEDGVRGDRWSGRFSRSFELPYEVEVDAVEAVMKNGLLQITLPRAQSSRPKKITVK